ncbi:MAG: anthranilate synthase component I family protein [Saprospiraceae bacterium]
MEFHFTSKYIKTLSDIHTPVELYLKLRDKFPNSILLESSDYKSRQNSFSYICLDSIASFIADAMTIEIVWPDGNKETHNTKEIGVVDKLNAFSNSFNMENLNLGFVTNGLFGYTTYDAIPLFEEIEFKNQSFDLPLMQYHLYRYIVVFNHFNNELYLIQHLQSGEEASLSYLSDLIANRAITQFPFATKGGQTSNFSDTAFLEKIEIGKAHCFRGDVFQVVMSRKFQQSFIGDEFNVYRALRSINPSPYLFYFDYTNFKIFGSSPEAQLTISDHKAMINPIAGTFKRTGNSKDDEALAIALRDDPKENAEHIMLVDLARNDLSQNSKKVSVDSFKQTEFYSHVIHLVSKVSAELEENFNPVRIFADTFPAGTLSGAPKYRAMQIIDKNEPDSRGFYGGAIGYLGSDRTLNHAIFIRSFVSRNNTLTYQAGCGIVSKSDPATELQEVENKLSALRKAIQVATQL